MITIEAAAWAAAPARLVPGAVAAYRLLARTGEYGEWWADACGGDAPGIRRFLLETNAEYWERPWEATVSALPPWRWADVSVARRLKGQAAILHAAEIDEPLRVLVLQGAPSGEGLTALDLAAELRQLQSAYGELDAAAKALVAPLSAAPARGENLEVLLAKERPNVLWLSGHGRADPPSFLLADGSWLTPAALAEALRAASAASGRVPLYVVLWACRTGLPERFAAPRAAPPFIAALAELGVAAVLATQAPLADDVAPLLARSLFTNLVAGRPLDHAMARARGELLRLQGADGSRDDWACPVVWCVDFPPESLIWTDHRQAAAQRQDLARRLLPPDLSPILLDPVAYSQAEVWASHPRLWITSPAPASYEARSEWLARTLAQQQFDDRSVIVFDFASGGPLKSVLQDWALQLRRRTDGADDPDRSLRTLAQVISNDPETGWCKLCTSEVFTLALLSPPMEAPDWFWQSLRGAPARAIVLAKDFDGPRADEGWRLDTMTDIAPAVEGLARVPLAAALALLAAPAEQLDIEAVDPLALPAWLADGTVVTTRGGCVMPLARAEVIARELTEEQRRKAHHLAFTLLSGPRAMAKMEEDVNEGLLRARLYHARAADWTEAITEAAQRLMILYRHQRRAGALLGVFEQVSAIHRKIDEVWKIWAGWAYLSVGSPDSAETWLDLAEPLELVPEDQATRLMLLAEAAKSSGQAGSKERARAYLEEALAVAETGTGDNACRVALQIRHDLARLTHFLDHDAATAIPLYESIERDWQTLPHAGLDRAITLRNLAEAKMTVAKTLGAAGKTALIEAEQHLDTAHGRSRPGWWCRSCG